MYISVFGDGLLFWGFVGSWILGTLEQTQLLTVFGKNGSPDG